MAEFDPTPPKDATEAAYAQALLGDEAGREQRRARLMAALPRPQAGAAAPVARAELAWRWQPYAWGLLATGLLFVVILALKGRPADTRPRIDPRLAAAPAASNPVVVVQAEPPVASSADARVAAAPPVAVKIIPAKPSVSLPPPVMMADASLPQQRREAAAAVSAATESARLALEPVPMVAAPAAPPPAQVTAAAPIAPPAAPAPAAAPVAPPTASRQAEAQTRADAAAGLASSRSRAALAASEVAPGKPVPPDGAALLAAVETSDLTQARSALQAGASAGQRDPHGRTALMLAARSGSREMVDLLLAAGARRSDRDPQGWTAADHARDRGHEELAERLR